MKYLFFATQKGTVKKTGLEEYKNIRRAGLIAIKLDKDDLLLSASPTSGKDEAVLVTAMGKSIRFSESDVRATGRATMGVRGIKLKKGDQVVSMQVISKSQDKKKDSKGQKNKQGQATDQLLVVTENGYGKRTSLKEYSTQGRGGQGIYTAKIGKKTGNIVDAYLVGKDNEEDDLLITSQAGKIIRLSLADVPELGRHTQGVRLIRLDSKDSVAALTPL